MLELIMFLFSSLMSCLSVSMKFNGKIICSGTFSSTPESNWFHSEILLRFQNHYVEKGETSPLKSFIMEPVYVSCSVILWPLLQTYKTQSKHSVFLGFDIKYIFLQLSIEIQDHQIIERISPWARYVTQNGSSYKWLFWNPPHNQLSRQVWRQTVLLFQRTLFNQSSTFARPQQNSSF